MRNDFDMIIHKFPKKEDLHLHFIADVHLGAKEHMEQEWGDFCSHILEDPNAYLILAGDLINNATRTSVSNIFDETMRPREQKILMTEMLKPLANRILCGIPGNHEGRSGKDADDDPMYDIMCKLNKEDLYRENMAFIKISIGTRGTDHHNPTYALTVVHGSGGGIWTGAAVNRNERFGYTIDGTDALLVGHTHKPYVAQPGKIYIDTKNNTVSIKPLKVIVATSWMNYGGYAARKQMLPASYAKQVITLHGDKKLITVEM
jgi:predicted phosphodiesterase